jgi:hypothetical protein
MQEAKKLVAAKLVGSAIIAGKFLADYWHLACTGMSPVVISYLLL